MKESARIAVWLTVCCALAACSSKEAPLQPDQLSVFVSVPPLAYLAQAVGGSRVTVHTLMTPGQDPHSFEPGPRLNARLASARLYFAVGLPFEVAALPRVTDAHASLEVVHVAAEIHSTSDEIHDSHVWTSPLNASRVAAAMAAALCRVDAPGCDAYRSHFHKLDQEMRELHQVLADALAPVRGGSFFVFHPAWGHFAHTYGLQQRALEREGKLPNARHIVAFIDAMKSAGATALIVQPRSSHRAARVVADEVGVDLVTLNPLRRNLPAHFRYLAKTLKRVLTPQ